MVRKQRDDAQAETTAGFLPSQYTIDTSKFGSAVAILATIFGSQQEIPPISAEDFFNGTDNSADPEFWKNVLKINAKNETLQENNSELNEAKHKLSEAPAPTEKQSLEQQVEILTNSSLRLQNELDELVSEFVHTSNTTYPDLQSRQQNKWRKAVSDLAGPKIAAKGHTMTKDDNGIITRVNNLQPGFVSDGHVKNLETGEPMHGVDYFDMNTLEKMRAPESAPPPNPEDADNEVPTPDPDLNIYDTINEWLDDYKPSPFRDIFEANMDALEQEIEQEEQTLDDIQDRIVETETNASEDSLSKTLDACQEIADLQQQLVTTTNGVKIDNELRAELQSRLDDVYAKTLGKDPDRCVKLRSEIEEVNRQLKSLEEAFVNTDDFFVTMNIKNQMKALRDRLSNAAIDDLIGNADIELVFNDEEFTSRINKIRDARKRMTAADDALDEERRQKESQLRKLRFKQRVLASKNILQQGRMAYWTDFSAAILGTAVATQSAILFAAAVSKVFSKYSDNDAKPSEDAKFPFLFNNDDILRKFMDLKAGAESSNESVMQAIQRYVTDYTAAYAKAGYESAETQAAMAIEMGDYADRKFMETTLPPKNKKYIERLLTGTGTDSIKPWNEATSDERKERVQYVLNVAKSRTNRDNDVAAKQLLCFLGGFLPEKSYKDFLKGMKPMKNEITREQYNTLNSGFNTTFDFPQKNNKQKMNLFVNSGKNAERIKEMMLKDENQPKLEANAKSNYGSIGGFLLAVGFGIYLVFPSTALGFAARTAYNSFGSMPWKSVTKRVIDNYNSELINAMRFGIDAFRLLRDTLYRVWTAIRANEGAGGDAEDKPNIAPSDNAANPSSEPTPLSPKTVQMGLYALAKKSLVGGTLSIAALTSALNDNPLWADIAAFVGTDSERKAFILNLLRIRSAALAITTPPVWYSHAQIV